MLCSRLAGEVVGPRTFARVRSRPRLLLLLVVARVGVSRRGAYHRVQVAVVATQVGIAPAGQVQVAAVLGPLLERVRRPLAHRVRPVAVPLVFVRRLLLVGNRIAGLSARELQIKRID